ncbi:UNC93-like protein 2 [Smittium culicis]|uniref:UNC93-like protein 2 n=1 Tax=Smittium culicis TaxID=133412 RepID=A0A1R1Y0H0_9FUNG|nr:UNC93-like protein 2 [Smittium culicis]
MFKHIKILKRSIVQVIVISFILFSTSGIYGVLLSVGGGGQIDSRTASISNAVLYAFYSVFGIIGGGALNLFNFKTILFFCASTYSIYTGSFIHYNNTKSQFFTIFSGALLGIGSGILWTSQGMMLTSYSLENEKGKFISIFFSITSLGGVLGSLIPLLFGLENTPLKNEGYLALVLVQSFGALLCFLIVSPKNVNRSDGSKVETEIVFSVKSEIVQLLRLFKNVKLIMLIPLIFASSFYNPYLFNHFNLTNFDSESRGFNSLLLSLSGIIGSITFPKLLDIKVRRKKRAYISSILIFLLMNILWLMIFIQQSKFNNLKKSDSFTLYNFKKTGLKYIYPCFIFCFFGFVDSSLQTYICWLVGSFSNNSSVLSRYFGFTRFVQGIVMSIAFSVDGAKIESNRLLIANWILAVSTLPSIIYISSTTTNSVEKFESDLETTSNVADSLATTL